MSNQVKTIILSTGLALVTLQSCIARKEYQRPQEIQVSNLYRTDQINEGGVSFATKSWRELFTDPILQKHIEKGLANNLDIRMATQNIRAAEAYLKQSKAAFQPTLSVGANYTFQTQSLNTQFGAIIGERRYVNQYDLSASIGWEADIWGKLKSQEKAQYASYLGTIATHQGITSDLVASIASAYYQLLAFDEQKKLINETILLRQKNLETTKALKDAGNLTEVAVQQSQALVYNAQAQLIDLDTQIQIVENTLNVLMGENPKTIERNTIQQQILPKDISLGFAADLLSNRPDVMKAEFDLINTFELTNVARANFYPTFRITGSGGLQTVDIDKLFNVNSLFASVVGGIAQPLLNRRQNKTTMEVSIANQERAYLNYRKTLLSAGKEVSDALRTFSAQQSYIDLKEKEAVAYKKSIEFSQELVNYGMANYLEVLNASVNALNAELNITNAKLTQLRATVNLYQALGGGWK